MPTTRPWPDERAFRKVIGLEKLPERTPLNTRMVSIQAGDVVVLERPKTESSFTITRDGNPGKPLTILFPVRGSFERRIVQ